MKKNKRKIPDLKGRDFNGTYYPKIRRVKPAPRQRIRQLLRSFVPLQQLDKAGDNDKKPPV